MIDTSKLLSKRTSSKTLLSREGVTNLIIIKKNVVKIDGLLKERLILSKVREGLLKQQRENEKRRERERQLEADRKEDDTDVNPKSKKKPKGILGGILKAILGGFFKFFGRFLFRILPRLPFLIKLITKFGKFFFNLVGGLFRFTRVLIARGLPLAFNALKGLTKTIFTTLLRLVNRVALGIVPKAINFLRGIGIGSGIAGGAQITGATDFSKIALSKTTKTETVPKPRPGQQLGLFEESNRVVYQEPLEQSLETPRKISKKYASKITAESVVGADGIKFKPRQTELFSSLDTRGITIRQITTPKPGEIEATRKLIKKLGNENIVAQNLRLNRNVSDVMNELDMIEREALENIDLRKQIEKESGTRIRDFKPQDAPLKKAIVGDQPLMTAPKIPKVNASKLVGKKGLSKILFNVGGEALEQSVKQSIKASVGVIPILGDLIGVLLDIFLFGEPVGRALFKGVGSFALGALFAGVGAAVGGPPGALIGSILGGIGGDILGGIAYDLFFGREPQAGGYSTVTGGSKEYLKGVSKARGLQNFNEGGAVREYEPPSQVPFDKSTNLRSLAFYEKTQVGKEVMIPIPIPMPSSKNQSQGSTIVINKTSGERNVFSQHYRRG